MHLNLNKVIPRLAPCLLLLWLTGANAASEPTGEDRLSATAQLKIFLKEMKTLRSSFQQVIYANDDPQGETAAGVLYIQRPDLFRWNYTRPGQQQIIADGLNVWYYEPDLEQASVQFQSIALKGTPAKALISEEPVETFFNLEEQGEREGLAWVLLTPKEEEPRFGEIELGFSDNLLQAMRMVDSFGQTTWFLFQDTEINGKLDRELFRFEPPARSDIFNN